MKSIKNNAVFVRSILDLGDFNDDEKYDLTKEPSLTDPSQDEPIEALVSRMLRGEIVGHGMPQFDMNDDMPSGEAFDLQAETSRKGFDLADAALIQKRAIRAIKALKKPKEVKPSTEGEKSGVEPPAAPPAAK